MAIGTTAAIIGGSIIGAGASAVAGSKAAKAQKNAARDSLDLQKEIFETNRADQAPFRETGVEAVNALKDIFINGNTGNVQELPNVAFAREEGEKAINRSAAARGRFFAPSSTKDLIRFNQGLATQNFDKFTNALRSLAGQGQIATNATQNAGINFANSSSELNRAVGDARASSFTNIGNSINSGLGNVLFGLLRGVN